jgi:hypothetical protein
MSRYWTDREIDFWNIMQQIEKFEDETGLDFWSARHFCDLKRKTPK